MSDNVTNQPFKHLDFRRRVVTKCHSIGLINHPASVLQSFAGCLLSDHTRPNTLRVSVKGVRRAAACRMRLSTIHLETRDGMTPGWEKRNGFLPPSAYQRSSHRSLYGFFASVVSSVAIPRQRGLR